MTSTEYSAFVLCILVFRLEMKDFDFNSEWCDLLYILVFIDALIDQKRFKKAVKYHINLVINVLLSHCVLSLTSNLILVFSLHLNYFSLRFLLFA